MSVVLAPSAMAGGIEEGRAALFGGDPERAARLFQDVAEARPADHDSRYWLYSALMAARRPDEARPMLEAARTLHAVEMIRAAGADLARFQTDKAYCADIGQRLYASKLMGAASVCLGRSLDLDNLNPQHMVSYGLSLQHQGRMDEAIAVFTAAAQVFQNPDVHAFLLYPLFHAPDRLKRVSDEARKWGELHAAPKTPAKPVFTPERTANRRLRIGYVGPSFTRNQVAQFLLPVLENHDLDAVEVFLYCANPQGEADLPAECEVAAIGGLSDADVAARIRADRIDILVDVWGHTADWAFSATGRRRSRWRGSTSCRPRVWPAWTISFMPTAWRWPAMTLISPRRSGGSARSSRRPAPPPTVPIPSPRPPCATAMSPMARSTTPPS
jgi:tetratricopeptide (TPR) repeat protein